MSPCDCILFDHCVFASQCLQRLGSHQSVFRTSLRTRHQKMRPKPLPETSLNAQIGLFLFYFRSCLWICLFISILFLLLFILSYTSRVLLHQALVYLSLISAAVSIGHPQPPSSPKFRLSGTSYFHAGLTLLPWKWSSMFPRNISEQLPHYPASHLKRQ
jgi:hypothetical protein